MAGEVPGMGQPLSSVASAQWLTPSGRGQSQARLSGLNKSISRRFTAFVGSSRHWAHLWGSGRFHPRSAVPAPPTPHPRPWAPGRRQRARARGHGLLANKPHRPEPLRGSRVEEKPSWGCTRISPPRTRGTAIPTCLGAARAARAQTPGKPRGQEAVPAAPLTLPLVLLFTLKNPRNLFFSLSVSSLPKEDFLKVSGRERKS